MSAPKPRAFVWGASGHAKVVADAALSSGHWDLVGFVDERRPERKGELMMGMPVLGGADALQPLRESGVTNVLLGVGDCEARFGIYVRARELGFEMPAVVHPRSVVATEVQLGDATVIMAGVVVNPGVAVGSAVILNTSCSVDHDCTIGDAAHLSPGVRLAGGVRVGRLSWIGIGSSIIQSVSIGANAVVGAGSVVLRDVPDHSVAYGVPATWRRGRPA